MDLTHIDITKPSKFENAPAGRYKVIISNVEEKELKNNAGRGLMFSYKILEGLHAGKIINEMFNVEHTSVQAAAIALDHLTELCRAVNVNHPKNQFVLLNKILVVTTKQNGEYCNVSKHEAFQSSVQQSAQQYQQPPVQPQYQPQYQQPPVQPAYQQNNNVDDGLLF